MPYNDVLYKKYYGLIDAGSGSCRVRNHIIKKWRETGDLAGVIDEAVKMNYSGTNVQLLIEIKERYQNEN